MWAKKKKKKQQMRKSKGKMNAFDFWALSSVIKYFENGPYFLYFSFDFFGL